MLLIAVMSMIDWASGLFVLKIDGFQPGITTAPAQPTSRCAMQRSAALPGRENAANDFAPRSQLDCLPTREISNNPNRHSNLLSKRAAD
jgi:hypothetical protein